MQPGKQAEQLGLQLGDEIVASWSSKACSNKSGFLLRSLEEPCDLLVELLEDFKKELAETKKQLYNEQLNSGRFRENAISKNTFKVLK